MDKIIKRGDVITLIVEKDEKRAPKPEESAHKNSMNQSHASKPHTNGCVS